MEAVKQLKSLADVDEVLALSASRPVLVFKHSTQCPRSARAYQEWQQFLASPASAGVMSALVRVIEERPVSLALAERVGVTHQSPQALLIRDGRALWHASHEAITAAALAQAVAQAG